MKRFENEYEGIAGLKIYYQYWLPDNPKAVLLIVHGFAEHSGRYMNVVKELIPLGYAIYANDHRGHGKSEGIRNYVDSFDQYIEDEKKLYDIIGQQHPDLPIFMLGHSMGSTIALYFTKKYEHLLKGLILSGVGTDVGGGGVSLLKVVSKFSEENPTMEIPPNLNAEFLSHDPEVVKAYQTDPLVNADKITARLAFEFFNSLKNVESFVKDLKIDLLVQSGSEDKLITGSEKLENLFMMGDKTIIIYEGLYHEVYNEVEQERKKVLTDLRNWLEKHN
ncbi:MAG: alpha/beta hydrolase [Promethearchaeota archaeon]